MNIPARTLHDLRRAVVLVWPLFGVVLAVLA